MNVILLIGEIMRMIQDVVCSTMEIKAVYQPVKYE